MSYVTWNSNNVPALVIKFWYRLFMHNGRNNVRPTHTNRYASTFGAKRNGLLHSLQVLFWCEPNISFIFYSSFYLSIYRSFKMHFLCSCTLKTLLWFRMICVAVFIFLLFLSFSFGYFTRMQPNNVMISFIFGLGKTPELAKILSNNKKTTTSYANYEQISTERNHMRS